MISLSQITFFLKNKRNRNILLLIILVVIWGVLLSINYSSPEPKQSERVLVCEKCGYTAVMKFSDLSALICPKCHEGKMHYAMKCSVCQYEFPFINPHFPENLPKSERRKRLEEYLKCPNCGSHEVYPISVKFWEIKQKEK